MKKSIEIKNLKFKANSSHIYIFPKNINKTQSLLKMDIVADNKVVQAILKEVDSLSDWMINMTANYTFEFWENPHNGKRFPTLKILDFKISKLTRIDI